MQTPQPTFPFKRTFPWLSGSLLLVAVLCAALYWADGRSTVAKTQAAQTNIDAGAEDRVGEDWPAFLGPRGTGVSAETGLLQKWPQDGPPVLWEKEVGTGYSAPSVRGNRLVVHHRIGNEEIVECLRADTGDALWKYAYPSRFRDPYGYNNGPRCSPVLTEDRCYTFGAEGKLLCLDLKSGEKIWLRDTQQDFTVPEGFFGVGATPLLEGDLLIVLVGGQPNSGVVAFEAETGKTVWQSVGKDTWNGVLTGDTPGERYEWTGEEMVVSYASPAAATIHGKRHILCLMRHGLVSVDPRTGEENFKYWFKSRIYESVNAAQPVVVGDKILLSAAYRSGAALLQVNDDGKSYSVVWRDPRGLSTHWSTTIHHDGYLYGFSGRHEQEATLQCVELETGKLVWETTGFEGNLQDLGQDPATGRIINRKTGEAVPWPFYGRGSAIMADGKFIVLGERGTLALVNVDPQTFKESSRASFKQIGYPSWAAPVLSRKRLYLRDEDHLMCLDLAER
jgi:outer membrane protein assembly factor BamB